MTVVFTGGELSSFYSTGLYQTPPTIAEYAGQYDGNYARICMIAAGINGAPQPSMTGTFVSAVSDFWTHMEFNTSIGEGTSTTWWPVVLWGDTATDVKFRLQYRERPVSGVICPAFSLEYYGASGWTSCGTYRVQTTDKQTLDIHIKIGNTGAGRLRMYNSGTKVVDSGLITTVAPNAIKYLEFKGSKSGTTGVGAIASQVIVADTCTIGWKARLFVPTGAGTDADWTGAYTAIDNSPTDITSYISTTTNNAVSTFAATPVHALDGSLIKAFVVAASAVRLTGSGPTQLQTGVRVGSTNYFGTAVAQGAYEFQPVLGIWNTNPATGVAWVDANLSGVKIGVKAIA